MTTFVTQQTKGQVKKKRLKALQKVSLTLLFGITLYSTYWLFHKLPFYWCKDFYGTYSTPFRYESYTVTLIIALLVFFSFQSQRILFKIASSLLLIFCCLLIASSWLNFDFYRDFISSSALQLLPDMINGKSAAGLNELNSFPYAIQLLIGSTFFLITLWGLSSFIHIKANRSLTITYLTVTLLYVSFLQYRYYSDDPAALPFYTPPTHTHPVAYFVKSFFNEKISFEEKHIEAAKFLNGVVIDPHFPLIKTSHPTNKPITKKNVILIVLESLRAAETQHFGGASPIITPHLDTIAKQSTTFSNFYANSTQTIRGEVAILCSMLDFSKGAPTSRRGIKVNMSCLPEILGNHGYQTIWYHGFDKTFFSRNQFHPQIGFQEMHSQSRIKRKVPNAEIIGWGISDKDMFKYAFDDLENRKSPFFAEILTLTNHFPFDNDLPKLKVESKTNSTVYNQYLRSIHYTDQALGEFWEAFQRSHLADNTIVVIVADHGIWISSSKDDANNTYLQHEMQFRIPMLIWEKNKPHSSKKTIASQVDITPTILTKLGIMPNKNHFIGEDLFHKNRRELALMTGFGQFASRDSDAFCYPNISSKKEGFYELNKKAKEPDSIDLKCKHPTNNILLTRHKPQINVTNENLSVYRNIIELTDITLTSSN